MESTDGYSLGGWLEEQDRETCIAIAYRAALRVFPFVTTNDLEAELKERVALSTLRAILTSGVASSAQLRTDRKVAKPAYEAAYMVGFKDATAADAALAAAFAADGASASYAADAAANAVSHAKEAAGFVDTGNSADMRIGGGSAALLGTRITRSPALRDLIAERCLSRQNLLDVGGPWSFWRTWYDHAMAGEPLAWDLQLKVAEIPNSIWEKGAKSVAEAIERCGDAGRRA